MDYTELGRNLLALDVVITELDRTLLIKEPLESRKVSLSEFVQLTLELKPVIDRMTPSQLEWVVGISRTVRRLGCVSDRQYEVVWDIHDKLF